MPVFNTSAQSDQHNFDSDTVKSTLSTLDSPIMTPSSSCDDTATVSQPILTSEIISNLMNRIENVSHREGIVSEREKFLRFQIKALTKQEEALDKREQELDFKKLPAVEKLKVAVEQLKASDEPVVSSLFRDFYKKVSARNEELEARLREQVKVNTVLLHEEEVKVNAILLLQAEERRARENKIKGATTAELATDPAPLPTVTSSSSEKPNDASKRPERQDEQIEKEQDELVEAISDNPISTAGSPDDRKPKESINPPPTSTFDFNSASHNPDHHSSPHTARNEPLSQPLFSTSTQLKPSALSTVNSSPVSTSKTSQTAPPPSPTISDISDISLHMPIRQLKNASALFTKPSAKVKREPSRSQHFGAVSTSSSASTSAPPLPHRECSIRFKAPIDDTRIFKKGAIARDTTPSPADECGSGEKHGPSREYSPSPPTFSRSAQMTKNRFKHIFGEEPQPYDSTHGWESVSKTVEKKLSGPAVYW